MMPIRQSVSGCEQFIHISSGEASANMSHLNRTFSSHTRIRADALEGVSLAPFWRRAGAWVIDFLIVVLLAILAGLPSALEHRADSGQVVVPFDPFHSLTGLGLFFLYFGLGTYLGRGQTIGKLLFRIRVLSLVHERLSLWHSLERALGYAASALEAGFGFAQYFIHPNRQTVHDRIAETIVVACPRKRHGAGSTPPDMRV
jgi:uncharacterized RDD family membrane protein YckC